MVPPFRFSVRSVPWLPFAAALANLYDNDRPVPITDQGLPIKQLFS